MSSLLSASPEREAEIHAFLDASGWQSAARAHLTGDASNRRYERLHNKSLGSALLMDAPPDPNDTPLAPGQKSYGEIAHLASDCRPFVAIATYLKERGFSAPEIMAFDIERGLILLEDLGDATFGSMIAGSANPKATQNMLYEQAALALAQLHRDPVERCLKVPSAFDYDLPPYDPSALHIETELLLDWFAPAMLGQEIAQQERDQFHDIWEHLIESASFGDEVLVQRDYHSPNLIWLAERRGIARVGMIDFQDGMRGPCAYDLVSLLQDARRDIPEQVEQQLRSAYLQARPGLDREGFDASYAILGAQRCSKIIGIFFRLWKRDGKKNYLQHLPRMWQYLDRNLTHPKLNHYRQWIERNVPEAFRVPTEVSHEP
jgi:aminoglycoside/choline kinase family phosphotransferase